MNLRRLEYFLTVARSGRITEAAALIGMAQPALSRQVKTLERELGFALFHRGPNGVELTAAGSRFVPVAQSLVRNSRDAKSVAETLRSGTVSRLEVVATIATIRGLLAPFIATLDGTGPMLVAHAAAHQELLGSLDDDADFILTPLPEDPRFTTVALVEAPIYVHVSPGHRWAAAQRSEIDLGDLAGEKLVIPTTRSVSRTVIDAAVSAGERCPDIVAECDDGAAALALASAGYAVGVTTETAGFDVHTLSIMSSGRPLTISLHAAWKPDHFADETIRGVVDAFREFALAHIRSLHDRGEK